MEVIIASALRPKGEAFRRGGHLWAYMAGIYLELPTRRQERQDSAPTHLPGTKGHVCELPPSRLNSCSKERADGVVKLPSP